MFLYRGKRSKQFGARRITPSQDSNNQLGDLTELARSTIRMHLADNVYFSVTFETTVYSLWDKL
jgi:hypothetical protein